MSLVAYAASSDEESGNDETENTTKVGLKMNTTPTVSQPETATNDDVVDDDDYNEHSKIPLKDLKINENLHKVGLILPKPKNAILAEGKITAAFTKLPKPRARTESANEIIEETDDEFLHKKAVSVEVPKPPAVSARVKIRIPALKDFDDVDREKAAKSLDKNIKNINSKGSGLLSILPPAKSDRNFAKQTATQSTAAAAVSIKPAFIPDTVRNRRPAYNTEGVDGIKTMPKKTIKEIEPAKTAESNKITLLNVNDSEVSDENEDDAEESGCGGDFFSLKAADKLPQISINEINALVAKRAAKMAKNAIKHLNATKAQEEAAEAERLRLEEGEQLAQAQKRYYEEQLNREAMDALVGKNAKRRRKEAEQMQIIDINSSEIHPDRDEWLRSALASSTTYQPTGVINDEEPAAGTRRKHQITYLAHKAKNNEAELQAMWSANRQNRRAAQSKYGF